MSTLYKGGDPYNWLTIVAQHVFSKIPFLALLCIFYTVSHHESHLKYIVLVGLNGFSCKDWNMPL